MNYEDMKILAIILARGGSKGIPRKNVRLLAGKPLVTHTIEHARQARSVDRVVVSTDDPEIAAVSQRYGAEVVWRAAEISGGMTSSESALLRALEYLQQTERYEPDLVVFLQCTSPLMLPEDIDGTIQVLLDKNADSALAVTPFHYFLWRQDQKGDAVGMNHDKRVRPLRQQREPQFLETGAVYVMRTERFKKAKRRFFGKTAMYIMPPERCLKIDEAADFIMAETLLQYRQRRMKFHALPDPVSALVLDFDGVFTDNRVLVLEDGREAVFCNRSDGLAVEILKKRGISQIILSTESNDVVRVRAKKLDLPVIYACGDKKRALIKYCKEKGYNLSKVAYIGNDINDLEAMKIVGYPIAPADAHIEIKKIAKIVTKARGGDGVIREVVDFII